MNKSVITELEIKNLTKNFEYNLFIVGSQLDCSDSRLLTKVYTIPFKTSIVANCAKMINSFIYFVAILIFIFNFV